MLAALIMLAAGLNACKSDDKKENSNTKTTQSEAAADMEQHELIKTDDDSALMNTGALRALCETSQEEMMLAVGRVFNCLGEPVWISENSENWFWYSVLFDGVPFWIGGDSLAVLIGGADTPETRAKADELAAYIMCFEPKDIHYEAYYLDYMALEIFEIKNGVPNYHSRMLDLTEEEFNELFKRLYGIDNSD